MFDLTLLWIGMAVIILTVFAVWIPYRIRYRVNKNHFEILLFGLPIRWVSLDNIHEVSKKHTPWAEQWWCTWRPHRRRLLIRRKSGLIKNIVVTPKYRYELKAELEKAMAKRVKNS